MRSIRFMFMVAAAVAGLLMACSKPAPLPPLDDDSAIREAVFRYQFNYYKAYLGKRTPFYCLEAADHADPPSQLMARFSRTRIPVIPVSECKSDIDAGVTHAKLKGRGLILIAAEISRTGETGAQVSGGYYGHGLAASGGVYMLELVDGKWKVVGERMDWES